MNISRHIPGVFQCRSYSVLLFFSSSPPALRRAPQPPLLWIETRHGDDVGDFHTASVYLHLLQADRAKNRAELTRLALEKNQKKRNYTARELRKLMGQRTKKKAQWAEEQLQAMAVARRQKHLDLKTLRGSYAGAFGLPQFIPASYQAYARSAKPGA